MKANERSQDLKEKKGFDILSTEQPIVKTTSRLIDNQSNHLLRLHCEEEQSLEFKGNYCKKNDE